jgi:hypothetical protein
LTTSQKGSFSTALDIAERKEALRPRRDLKYLNATGFVSPAAVDVAGFGEKASESMEAGFGAPKKDGTAAGVGCAGEGADTASGCVAKVNVLLDTEVPAPKPTNPTNLG